jgi:hypothetical protein
MAAERITLMELDELIAEIWRASHTLRTLRAGLLRHPDRLNNEEVHRVVRHTYNATSQAGETKGG